MDELSGNIGELDEYGEWVKAAKSDPKPESAKSVAPNPAGSGEERSAAPESPNRSEAQTEVSPGTPSENLTYGEFTAPAHMKSAGNSKKTRLDGGARAKTSSGGSAKSSAHYPDLSSEIPEGLMEEIKTVLTYMDRLLEYLPEEKIKEFAKSSHFKTYKKLFDELGLS